MAGGRHGSPTTTREEQPAANDKGDAQRDPVAERQARDPRDPARETDEHGGPGRRNAADDRIRQVQVQPPARDGPRYEAQEVEGAQVPGDDVLQLEMLRD